MRSVATITDSLNMVRAFAPEDADRIGKLVSELAEAKAAAKARAAVRDALPTATHVRLVDGWAEVVRIDGADVFVQVGENRPERVPARLVLEAKRLS